MTTILWTRVMLGRFKIAHADAVAAHKYQFVFDGHEYLTDYAKYLIEYLESRFAPS